MIQDTNKIYFSIHEISTGKLDLLGKAKKQLMASCSDGVERKAYLGMWDTIKIDTSDINATHGIDSKTTTAKATTNKDEFCIDFLNQPQKKQPAFYIVVKTGEQPNIQQASDASSLLLSYLETHNPELAYALNDITTALVEQLKKVNTTAKSNAIAQLRLQMAKLGLSFDDVK